MENFIKVLIEKNTDTLDFIKGKFSDIGKILFDACNNSDTTGFNDCAFLSLLIMNYKPKNILEIGTWVGTTSYAMALTDENCNVYTCDDNNRFVNLHIDANKRIYTHPRTHSTEFLKKMLNNDIVFDMVFNDATLTKEDCELLCKLTSKDFIFATHDYYNSNGGYEKGYDAMKKMKEVLDKNNIKYSEYIPQKEWYFADRINACSGLLVCNK